MQPSQASKHSVPPDCPTTVCIEHVYSLKAAGPDQRAISSSLPLWLAMANSLLPTVTAMLRSLISTTFSFHEEHCINQETSDTLSTQYITRKSYNVQEGCPVFPGMEEWWHLWRLQSISKGPDSSRLLRGCHRVKAQDEPDPNIHGPSPLPNHELLLTQ